MEKYQMQIPLPRLGINYIDDSLISDDEAAEGTVNISFKNGIPQTRRGYISQEFYAHTGESDSITKMFSHTVNTERRICYARGGDSPYLFQFNPTKSPVRRNLGVIETNKPDMIQFAGGFNGGSYSEKVIVLTGSGYKWFDDTANMSNVPAYTPTTEEVNAYGTNVLTTTPAEIRNQKWIVEDNGRYWVAGYKNIVRFSHLGRAGTMPDYWPSTQVMKLKEDCTGMTTYMSEVMLFTENTASLIEGNTPLMGLEGYYINKQLSGGYGCSNANTITKGDNSLYWANKKGVYRYTYMPSGFSVPECISEFVFKKMDGSAGVRSVQKKIADITDWTKVFAVFYDHEYRLYIGNGEVLIFDSIMNSWSLYKYYHNFSSGLAYDDVLLYGAEKRSGEAVYMYQMEYVYDSEAYDGYKGLSDNGYQFKTILKSKFFDFGKSANRKRFGRLYFTLYSDLLSYDILLKINMDNEIQIMQGAIEPNKVSRWGNNDPDDDTSEALSAFSFGDVIQADRTNLNYPVKLVHKGKRYNMQYELSTKGLNEAWLLKDVVLMLKVKELK